MTGKLLKSIESIASSYADLERRASTIKFDIHIVLIDIFANYGSYDRRRPYRRLRVVDMRGHICALSIHGGICSDMDDSSKKTYI